jgi:hypothetical protein
LAASDENMLKQGNPRADDDKRPDAAEKTARKIGE